MTTLTNVADVCKLCGAEASFYDVAPTNTFGAPDLDTRPPEMERSTMPYWIRRCPLCGYCAPELAKGVKRARAIVQSDDYRRQLDDDAYPELANLFLCRSIIQEQLAKYADAGWAAVHAAWVCDDEKPERAAGCRQRALELFERAAANGQSFMADRASERILCADLLRRCGDFDRAVSVCDEGLAAKAKGFLRQVLAYERALAAAGDGGCHGLDEMGEE